MRRTVPAHGEVIQKARPAPPWGRKTAQFLRLAEFYYFSRLIPTMLFQVLKTAGFWLPLADCLRGFFLLYPSRSSAGAIRKELMLYLHRDFQKEAFSRRRAKRRLLRPYLDKPAKRAGRAVATGAAHAKDPAQQRSSKGSRESTRPRRCLNTLQEPFGKAEAGPSALGAELGKSLVSVTQQPRPTSFFAL